MERLAPVFPMAFLSSRCTTSSRETRRASAGVEEPSLPDTVTGENCPPDCALARLPDSDAPTGCEPEASARGVFRILAIKMPCAPCAGNIARKRRDIQTRAKLPGG